MEVIGGGNLEAEGNDKSKSQRSRHLYHMRRGELEKRKGVQAERIARWAETGEVVSITAVVISKLCVDWNGKRTS